MVAPIRELLFRIARCTLLTVGRPPTEEAARVEVDPETMKVVKDFTPKAANEETGIFGVDGIDANDNTNDIWVTNTRQNTVSYYNRDRTLGNQYPIDLVAGSRDIYVDQRCRDAYVSTDKADSIYISSDQKSSSIGHLSLTEITGGVFNIVMSLVVDEETRTLYTTSMKDKKVAAVNLDDLTLKHSN